ncbi:NYN domain-containing protein [Accumulibacter sp.]|uniref:NYN domain-containing protein n=1 Tax=Accumulibacter sp. TaxID=2053492 RepID=UPI00261EB016|nr:NYN domain-containing protein [Accumulibacter sp.]
MAVAPETAIMALYCDFENVALGVRDAKYDKFDIKPVLERLLLKGSIVVKKAYCDWERYKGFKSTMHEASFELIEIPHLRQSGKNSADIRLVVDALDLCYTKAHVDTFVIISGDSDFSPLVSKLRENAKYVIGVGVKQSTSDLLIGNCDEFIFYDDLVRESQRAARRDSKEAQPVVKRSPEEDAQRKAELEARRSKAIELAVATLDALVAERGDSSKIWASMLKEAVKRRKPDFSESYYGFRAFGNLLEEAQARGLLEIGRDEKSGTYVIRNNTVTVVAEAPTGEPAGEALPAVGVPSADISTSEEPPDAAGGLAERSESSAASEGEGKARSARKTADKGVKRARGGRASKGATPADEKPPVAASADETSAYEQPRPSEAAAPEPGPAPMTSMAPVDAAYAAAEAVGGAAGEGSADVVGEAPPGEQAAGSAEVGAAERAEPVRKAPARSRRPRKPKVVEGGS